MKLSRKVGSTSEIWQVFIQDSSSTTGAGLTGLAFNTGSLTAYYHRDTDTTATAISLVTMTVGTFTSSGFKEIDSTNMPGWYQLCPPNAALASGAKSVGVHLKGAANMAPLPIEVDLDSQVDVTFWNGTVVATPATAGIPDVNAKNINNVAATSVTTINANVGTTQPTNFTGTAGSALIKSDTLDWNSVAVTGSVPPDALFLRSGTAQAGGASTIQLDAGASGTDNFYTGAIFIRSGLGAGQSNSIASYVGATKTATVTTAWATPPDNTSTFTVSATGAGAGGGSAPTAIQNADALLARNIEGGSSSGHIVSQALAFLRNKWTVDGSNNLTVFRVDGTTTYWTGVVGTTSGALPITSTVPA